MDALLTLSSKGQLVIPARLRQLLGLNPGDRLELSLEADGLLLKPHGSAKATSARDRIGCAGYLGPPIPLSWTPGFPPWPFPGLPGSPSHCAYVIV